MSYMAETCRILNRQQSHHETDDLSCFRELLKNEVFERLIKDNIRYASWKAKAERMSYKHGEHNKKSGWVFFQQALRKPGAIFERLIISKIRCAS